MTRIIDAGSHFMEPLDLWEQHIDPQYRSRCVRFEQNPKSNIWISADPSERTLPHMVELVGDDKLFVGSDYPHAEGFTEPVKKTRESLARLPEASVNKILGENRKR